MYNVRFNKTEFNYLKKYFGRKNENVLEEKVKKKQKRTIITNWVLSIFDKIAEIISIKENMLAQTAKFGIKTKILCIPLLKFVR